MRPYPYIYTPHIVSRFLSLHNVYSYQRWAEKDMHTATGFATETNYNVWSLLWPCLVPHGMCHEVSTQAFTCMSLGRLKWKWNNLAPVKCAAWLGPQPVKIGNGYIHTCAYCVRLMYTHHSLINWLYGLSWLATAPVLCINRAYLFASYWLYACPYAHAVSTVKCVTHLTTRSGHRLHCSHRASPSLVRMDAEHIAPVYIILYCCIIILYY